MRPSRWLLGVALGLAVAATALGQGPADDLFRLVPADAGAVLAVEDLRGHYRDFRASTLADGLRQLPAVRAWLESDAYRRFDRARDEIRQALGVPPGRLRDDLLGDAVVLALHIPRGEPAERARGLLLCRVRDPDLLRRLIDAANDAERGEGGLADVARRERGGEAYFVRDFRPGTKPPEFYAVLGGKTFAWSNSEDLIRGVIDRRAAKGGPAGLGDDPRFRKVRAALPARSAASLFVDPRLVERLAAADAEAKGSKAGGIPDLLGRHLAAAEYAGAALEWRDGFLLHVHVLVDPARAVANERRPVPAGRGSASLLRRAPATALAVAAGEIDLGAFYDFALSALTEGDGDRAALIETALRGILLGREPHSEVLAHLGPGALAYADAPSGTGPDASLALVVALALGEDDAEAGAPAAVENAARTALALISLGRKGPARIEVREVGGVRVTALAGGRFAFAVGRGALAFGSSPQAVAALFGGQGGAGPRLAAARAAYFPGADGFAFADLEGLYRFAEGRRPALAARLAARRDAPDVAEARRDLDQALALIRLFREAFAAVEVAPDGKGLHATLGLIARDPGAK